MRHTACVPLPFSPCCATPHSSRCPAVSRPAASLPLIVPKRTLAIVHPPAAAPSEAALCMLGGSILSAARLARVDPLLTLLGKQRRQPLTNTNRNARHFTMLPAFLSPAALRAAGSIGCCC